MGIVSTRFMQAAIFIILTIALATSAQATFSNASLKGTYSYTANIWSANPNTTETGWLAVITFDGAGNMSASCLAVSENGVQSYLDHGTYAVNANGTGTFSWASGNQSAITLNSTAAGVAHGVQIVQINYPYNVVIWGSAVLQSTTAQTYSVASIKGAFSFQWNQWTVDVNANQAASTGKITFDGKGNLKGSGTTVNGGVVKTGSFTGTYTVNADGSGTAILSNNTQWGFVLNNKPLTGSAKGAQFLYTAGTIGNVIVTGIVLKQ